MANSVQVPRATVYLLQYKQHGKAFKSKTSISKAAASMPCLAWDRQWNNRQTETTVLMQCPCSAYAMLHYSQCMHCSLEHQHTVMQYKDVATLHALYSGYQNCYLAPNILLLLLLLLGLSSYTLSKLYANMHGMYLYASSVSRASPDLLAELPA